MKYSLRKSFSFRRRKNRHHDDDDHPNTRIDQNICSNSNSNLVKGNQSKKFSRRRRCSSSSPPPPPPSLSSSTTTAAANKTKSKASKQLYNNHIDDDDDADGDDDPFSSSNNTRMRPLDKLTYQIRKSFRNTLTRQRPRLESNNSNKRLISTTNDENRPVNPIVTPVSTGLTSPIISLTETVLSDEKEKSKAVTKRRKAPLAPTHINQSYESLCFSSIFYSSFFLIESLYLILIALHFVPVIISNPAMFQHRMKLIQISQRRKTN